jgi:[ribosomal protein S5]-alanine N-acetyltransferase
MSATRGRIRLETERLVLQELLPGDWRAVHAHYSDPEAQRSDVEVEPPVGVVIPGGEQRLGGVLLPRRPWQSWVYVAGAAGAPCQPSAHLDLAVVLRGEAEPIGACSLTLVRAAYGALLGFIIDRRHWGRGYATEAARGMLRFGFQELELEQVSAGCDPENAGSRRVLEKIGMHYRGDEEWFPGSPHGVTSRVYVLASHEWFRLCGETPDATP